MSKLALLIAALLLISCTDNSYESVSCSSLKDQAASIMKLRQVGTSKAQVLSALGTDDELGIQLTDKAYGRPQLMLNSVIDREIAKFSNQAFKECSESKGK